MFKLNKTLIRNVSEGGMAEGLAKGSDQNQSLGIVAMKALRPLEKSRNSLGPLDNGRPPETGAILHIIRNFCRVRTCAPTPKPAPLSRPGIAAEPRFDHKSRSFLHNRSSADIPAWDHRLLKTPANVVLCER